MAVTEIVDGVRAWGEVVWDDPLQPASATEIRYGEEADELVARWDGFVPAPAVSVFFEHADNDGVGIVVNWATGHVIGIHVYPLLHRAIGRFTH